MKQLESGVIWIAHALFTAQVLWFHAKRATVSSGMAAGEQAGQTEPILVGSRVICIDRILTHLERTAPELCTAQLPLRVRAPHALRRL